MPNIIGYLGREDVRWDNVLLKAVSILSIGIMFSTGIKEGVRKLGRTRRQDDIEAIDDLSEELKDELLLSIYDGDLKHMPAYQRKEMARRIRRQLRKTHRIIYTHYYDGGANIRTTLTDTVLVNREICYN